MTNESSAVAALQELVALKELKEEFEALQARNHIDEPPLSRMSDAEIERWRFLRDEYARRNPLAWAEAKRVVAALSAVPVSPPDSLGASPFGGPGSAAYRPEPQSVSALRAPIPGAEPLKTSDASGQ